jgi:PAS domain S-box-containing protein
MMEKIEKIRTLIRSLNVPDGQAGQVGLIEDLLDKLHQEMVKINFKVERSIKEKNILSSLLTRTSYDLKKVSDNLKIRAEELSTLLTTIPAYVYFKDRNLNYIMVNQLFAELIGIPADLIVGKQLGDIMPGYNNTEYFVQERLVLDNGVALFNIEEEVVFHNRKRWVSSNIAPIRNTEGMIIGLIGISWDITERKLYEEELMIAKEAAEVGTLAKNEFIASVSHEFRTPMNGILGLADIMRTGVLQPEQLELLNGITTSARNLLGLLNDVLDFSAIEAGKMEFDDQPFMLDRVMEDIMIITKIRASEKSLDFQIKTDPGIPNYLIGDSQRLRQIIINLTNNAVKFTEKGKIFVRISRVEQTQVSAILRFEVTDTGIGINAQAKEALFKVFSRIREDKTKLIAGTGLGLSICKKLTEMMGGRIGVESEPGKGSTFWFTLPFSLTQVPEQKAKPIENEPEQLFTGKTVLVAEDNPINQRIATFQLQKMGFFVEMANDGQEALEKYLEKKYDLIILDIQMPRMDGYQVARAIRLKELETGDHVPVLALTANAMKGDRELYLGAGMDGYVSKPFSYEALIETIGHLLK